MARPGDADASFVALKKEMRGHWAKANTPCMRCGQPIDYKLRYPDPWSCSVGHIADWHAHPELRRERSNLQPEHLDCNKKAGRRDGRDRDMGMTSGLL